MTRISQVKKLPKEGNKAFEDLDSRFYDAAEDFDVLLPLYAIDNRVDFTAASGAP